ncbi:hypothetical protein AB0I60_12600 [Actinosynnema sp. NPDC050436]|uniref:hypothetical protein n=1 Tax=Actinosynnema sp. NPDC050436 TaxID=3155659 RepID=UPI0033C34B70
MSVVVLVLMIAALLAAIGLQVVMLVKDKPFYGVLSLCLMTGPGALLGLLYAALS